MSLTIEPRSANCYAMLTGALWQLSEFGVVLAIVPIRPPAVDSTHISAISTRTPQIKRRTGVTQKTGYAPAPILGSKVRAALRHKIGTGSPDAYPIQEGETQCFHN
ncbi:hypothetical protein Q4577_07825 [Marinovum sp. 2_MG-2023]|uniref:hypothetical protein n=1 Tax=unclassified Marinovum TaxID=2647166 RepID=UPI0026E13A43|nr:MULTISPECIES: hypothetical protein [unclassified Marinovum]MDO6729923.1 hypothetical protein [Marinovum sp. 2_MG-2023]MDO6779737.1 hypothetical protein [Marinovum sp. 1_MG-2023]